MFKLDLDPSARTLFQFGWISMVGFGVFAALAQWRWNAPAWVVWLLLGLSLVHGLGALARQRALLFPFFVGMTALAAPLGFAVTHLLLFVIFVALFVPIGLVFRLLGKDPLQRGWDRNAKTYWNERATERRPDSYLRLY